MAERGVEGTLIVLVNGKPALDSFPFIPNESVGALDARLTEILNLPSTHRILLRGRVLSYREVATKDAGVRAGDTLYVLASDDVAVQAVRSAKEDPLLRGFSRPSPKFAVPGPRPRRKTAGPSENAFGFREIRALPGYPDSIRAESILKELAEDPGFSRVMEMHHWKVGCLAEMEPDGKVGVDPVCVLGYNANKGAEIHLRLRTDDRKGFRPLYMLKQVLAHELAHNEHSEHDVQFKELMRKIEREAKQHDWTQSAGHAVGASHQLDISSNQSPDPRDPLDVLPRPPVHGLNFKRRLGSGHSDISSEARTSSVLIGPSEACTPPLSPTEALDHAAPEADVSQDKSGASSSILDKDKTPTTADGTSLSVQHDCQRMYSIVPPSNVGGFSNSVNNEVSDTLSPKFGTDHGTVDVLVAMGFSSWLSQVALRECAGNPSRAVDWLSELQSERNQVSHFDEESTLHVSAADGTYASRVEGALVNFKVEIGDKNAFADSLVTLHTYVYNIWRHGLDERFRSINSTNIAFNRRIGQFDSGSSVMRAIGFLLNDDGRWTLDGALDPACMWIAKCIIVRELVSI